MKYLYTILILVIANTPVFIFSDELIIVMVRDFIMQFIGVLAIYFTEYIYEKI